MVLEPVRPIELSEIRAARERIAKTIVRTPLIRLEHGSQFPGIWLKLENLQPINAYKLRGAANAVALLTAEEREQAMQDKASRTQRDKQMCHARSWWLKRRRNRNWNE